MFKPASAVSLENHTLLTVIEGKEAVASFTVLDHFFHCFRVGYPAEFIAGCNFQTLLYFPDIFGNIKLFHIVPVVRSFL